MEWFRSSMLTGLLVVGGILFGLGLGPAVGHAGSLDPQCAPTINGTTPCDDGNACTQGDHCDAGTCVGGASFWIKTRARLGNAVTLANDVTVNEVGGELALGRRAEAADGVRCAADSLRLGVGARAFDVAYNTINRGAARATIAGAQITPLALPVAAPFCAVAPTICGGPDVRLAPGEARELLAPQSYGGLRVARGATLTLAPGTFAFCDVEIARDATVHALGDSPTTIGVAGTLRLGPRAYLGAGPGGPMPQVHVDGHQVRLGRNAHLDALLTAPDAQTRVGRDATVNGTICTETLAAGHGATLACSIVCGDEVMAPGEGCDDGNTTSGDGCSTACLLECGGSVCAPGEICLGDQCFGASP